MGSPLRGLSGRGSKPGALSKRSDRVSGHLSVGLTLTCPNGNGTTEIVDREPLSPAAIVNVAAIVNGNSGKLARLLGTDQHLLNRVHDRVLVPATFDQASRK